MQQPLFARAGRIGVFITSLCLASLSNVSGAQLTIRVRFVNGKTGKPLRWKYPTVVPSSNGKVNYVFNESDRYSFEAVVKNTTTISVNQGYYRCDAAKETDPAVSYSVTDIVEHGAVSANFCGSSHMPPVEVNSLSTPGMLIGGRCFEMWVKVFSSALDAPASANP